LRSLGVKAHQGVGSAAIRVQADRGGSDSREQIDEGADFKKALTLGRKRKVAEYVIAIE